MNRIPLFQNERLKNNQFQIIDSERLQHFHETLKLQVGDECKVLVVDEGLFSAKILKLSESECNLALGDKQEAIDIDWRLSIGFCRPPSMEKILEHATTFGVHSFHFFRARLSDKSYEQSKLFRDKRYEQFLINGLAQSTQQYKLPKLKLEAAYQVPAPSCDQAFALSPFANETLSDQNLDFDRPIHLGIGPERGWTDSEIAGMQKKGWKTIKLGPMTLRVEHACFAACSQLHLLRENALKKKL